MGALDLLRKAMSKTLLDYYPQTVRPFVLSIPPDNGHDLGQALFRCAPLWKAISLADQEDYTGLETSWDGVKLKHGIGWAPSYIKNADSAQAFLYSNPGFIGIGSVRLNPYPGNPRPHTQRYSLHETGNSFGMPSKGQDYVLSHLVRMTPRCPVLVSVVGTDREVTEMTRRFGSLSMVSAVSHNISCPTDRGTADRSQDEIALQDLDLLCRTMRAQTSKVLFLKLAPIDVGVERERVWFSGVLDICSKRGFGLELFNTLRVREAHSGVGYAGLSSPSTFRKLVVPAVKFAFGYTGGRMTVIAEHGIRSGRDAFEAFASGASSVGIASLIVARGLGSIKYLLEGLRFEMAARGIRSVQELRGSEARIGGG
jgi:dihydroorotate dehydrogenase